MKKFEIDKIGSIGFDLSQAIESLLHEIALLREDVDKIKANQNKK